jgi:hypothetical protein
MIDMSSIIKKTTNVTAVITRNNLNPLMYSCSVSVSLFAVVVTGAVLSLELTSSALSAMSLVGVSGGCPSSKSASRIFSSLNLLSMSMTGTCCDAREVEEIHLRSDCMTHSLLGPTEVCTNDEVQYLY